MKRGKLALAILAAPATALLVGLSPSVSAATPTPAPTMIVTSPDPQCAFTNGCVSPAPSAAADPSPNAGVRGATVSTPATGGGGLSPLVPALPLAGVGAAAIIWARRRP